jgi:hypothetical protein
MSLSGSATGIGPGRARTAPGKKVAIIAGIESVSFILLKAKGEYNNGSSCLVESVWSIISGDIDRVISLYMSSVICALSLSSDLPPGSFPGVPCYRIGGLFWVLRIVSQHDT